MRLKRQTVAYPVVLSLGLALGSCSLPPMTQPHTSRSSMPVDRPVQLAERSEERRPINPGGNAATHHVHNQEAFARPAPTASASDLRRFNFGNRLFNTSWVIAPASVAAFDGLGPVFNRVSCSGCHVRDGRGRPPVSGESTMLSMLIRWSIPGRADDGGSLPVPGYGTQLNDRAIPGIPAEARVAITWRESAGKFGDGSTYSLREPQYQFSKPAFGPLPKAMLVSGRVAPAVFGLGLVEAIDAASIVENADPQDADGDGISGRPNWVLPSAGEPPVLGRFGWKAGAHSLSQQAADAARNDIGITTDLSPTENCADGQIDCAKAINGGSPEMDERSFASLVHYLRLLGVPSQRAIPDVRSLARGESIFSEFGCGDCHRPSWTTVSGAEPALLSDQTIHPYSDFLLHDLGAGLADNRPEYAATGSEWRTPPLWGVGLISAVNDHQYLLHDGRARGVAEAILWHAGEAEQSMLKFRAAPRPDREALVTFVNSL